MTSAMDLNLALKKGPNFAKLTYTIIHSLRGKLVDTTLQLFLTIPNHMKLMKLLGKFCTFSESKLIHLVGY